MVEETGQDDYAEREAGKPEQQAIAIAEENARRTHGDVLTHVSKDEAIPVGVSTAEMQRKNREYWEVDKTPGEK